MKYDLEKTVSTDQAFFFKTSCFSIKSFLLGTKTALHAFACGRKTNLMRNTVQSNQLYSQIKRFAMPLRLNPGDSRVAFHRSSTFWHPDCSILLPPCHDREFFRPARYSYDP